MTYINPSRIALILYSVFIVYLLPIYGYSEPYVPVQENDYRLYVAAQDGDAYTVKSLLKEGEVDVNAQGPNGWTPLHIAAWIGYLEVIEALLAAKSIQVNLQIKDGYSPLHAAADGGNVEVVKTLLNNKDIQVNIKNDIGLTPLHIAASKGHLEVIKELLNNKDIDANSKDKNNDTPLHDAVVFNRVAVVQTLLKSKDIEVNQANNLGETPLHRAAFHGNLEVIKALLQDSRVIANRKNKRGETPLDIAKKSNNKKNRYDPCIDLLQNGFTKENIKEINEKIRDTEKKDLRKDIEKILEKMINRNANHKLFVAQLLYGDTEAMNDINDIEKYSLKQQKKYFFKLPDKQLELILPKLKHTLKLIRQLDAIQTRLLRRLLCPLMRVDEPANKKIVVQELNNEIIQKEVEKGALQFERMIKIIQKQETYHKKRRQDYTCFPYNKLYMPYTWPSDLAKKAQEEFLNCSGIRQQAAWSDLQELGDTYESLEQTHKELLSLIPEHVKKELKKLSQSITSKLHKLLRSLPGSVA